jgi:hypothetical protein
MNFSPSRKTLDLQSRVGDAREKLRAAENAHKESAIDDLVAHLETTGIAPGDKVVICDNSSNQMIRTPAFYMGCCFDWGRAIPVLKKVKADGTPSSVNASFSAHSSWLEKPNA